MANPAVIRSGVGLRHVQVLAIGTDGYPAATGTGAYEGTTISGAVSLTLDDPEPQVVLHRGDDNIFAADTLPPTEPISGELTVSKTNDTLDAVLTDDHSIDIGETYMFGMGTDNRGDENQMVVLAYQQTLDTDPTSGDFGTRRWDSRLLCKTYVIPRATGLEQDTGTMRSYSVRPQFATEYPWGVTFTAATEGFLRAQLLRGISEFKPKIVAFKASGGEVTYSFPTAYPAAEVGKVITWVSGTLTTPATVLTTQFTYTKGATPAANAKIVVFYEYE